MNLVPLQGESCLGLLMQTELTITKMIRLYRSILSRLRA
jgi:hypothetical protein